ncbi:neutral zinc metallopeptidase [Streptosporangium sp. NBC_01639]|uniref:neutral zinc metallopeptidase n=1 Tax=unclassified Streptosporangium TaxID=2632669 RepID=UPI002DDB0F41|nr:neutral zinc metallopeptidase [Streptosporangium sp. NBC_01756]WSC87773.1 neutral zinc metallopeptidase [Streptosporangium sp. NBC_01756]WTD53549.1 neutral zinc metallopeptidase [Streptosporangium sp. NBC_01639]
MAFPLVMGVGVANAAAPSTAKTSVASVAPVASVASVAKEQAVPRGRAAATANPIYRTGMLPAVRCTTGQLRAGSAASYKVFMTRVDRCLNLAWKTQFKKAKLPFAQPKLRFTTSKVSSPCGRWPKGAGGYYCSSNRTIYIGVFREVLKSPYAPNHAQFMAHEYAHHVQQLGGIMNYYGQSVWRARTSTKLAYSRRLELQADCLGSAFLRQIADDLPVEQEQWDAMVDWVAENGHKNWVTNDHGKGRSQAYWMQRGYNAGGPSACNTWAASSRTVA